MSTLVFADLIIPAALPSLYRYGVPIDFQGLIQTGQRVVVPFGKGDRITTAIVHTTHVPPPEGYQVKNIIEILENEPSITIQQIHFWEWIAAYYLCNIGEVMNIALPAGLKLSSESFIQLNPIFETQSPDYQTNKQEEKILIALQNKKIIPYQELEDILGIKNPVKVINSLISKEIIILFSEIKEKFSPKKIKKIRLHPHFAQNQEALQNLFESLQKFPKQENILLRYLSLVPILQAPLLNDEGIEKNKFLSAKTEDDISESSLKTLITKQIFEEKEVIISRFETEEIKNEAQQAPLLSPPQQNALEKIMDCFTHKNTALLFGVTGSGKTEIYIHLIMNMIENGHQVLLLMPEIGITTQMVKRLRKFFGNRLGVYHSKFSDNERVEIWQGVKNKQFDVILGVRSSIFLPFNDLGLVIIDEEHENSYKQFDPAPRYHARDAALMLASMHHAKTLLGSATPSAESYWLAQNGKYGLVHLPNRYTDTPLPELVFADLKKEKQAKTVKDEFSTLLLEQIKANIEAGKQSILLQNRRGYAPSISCHECAWTPDCPNCSVSLHYHLTTHELRCHYCGYAEKTPKTCKACNSPALHYVGFGTQKIEETLNNLLKEALIVRMDADTTKGKDAYQNIINEVESRKANVLIGTQMVAKSFDFEHVTLIGIFDIDRMLHSPDFRGNENAFQLITQASGRAGRRNSQGKVIIQTYNPTQNLLQLVSKGDYQTFIEGELEERKEHFYPPFYRLIRLTIKSEDEKISQEAADWLAQQLIPHLGKGAVLGPQPPVVYKIRNLYLQQLLIKIHRNQKNLQEIKNFILQKTNTLLGHHLYRKSRVIIDVDPY